MERRLRQEVKAMTRNEVLVRAIAKKLTWIQAAEICGITARQMRRLKRRYERYGYDGLVDGRSGKPRRKRIPLDTIEQLFKLRREQYAEFSVQHFGGCLLVSDLSNHSKIRARHLSSVAPRCLEGRFRGQNGSFKEETPC